MLPRIEKTYKHINQNENKFQLVRYTAVFYCFIQPSNFCEEYDNNEVSKSKECQECHAL